jgi:malonyl CoA-acyl carrier protein transacylase
LLSRDQGTLWARSGFGNTDFRSVIMQDSGYRAIAIVGAGAVLPDAPSVPAFWENIRSGRYSITEVAPDRWDPALYYDPDSTVPDKTYSKIGGWVHAYSWDPVKWRLAVPPKVIDAMDEGQKWAIACAQQALEDYGYPGRPINADRTAVILGNAMAGEKHYLTALRVYFPEFAHELAAVPGFTALPESMRKEITHELHQRISHRLPEITEDSMPGELANCIAGRIANLFNLHGPNFVVDAACASAMAALTSAAEGLIEHEFDFAITGGIDRNMGVSTFVKFCKIGALSATGSRPYAEGADGFVMGEGAAIFLLKRLADAERDGDRIYAVLRGIGASSDGKGKGITAPNPLGQKLCIQRAWELAGLSPGSATYIEGHGTSTAVGDVVETQSMTDVLASSSVAYGSIALGSVKSNVGHLKGAAGAAGLLKTALALRNSELPPSVRCEFLNHEIDFAHSPLYVNRELKPWPAPAHGEPRRAGVSAFGFGGTNFHAVLEEYVPHRITGDGKRQIAISASDRPPGLSVDRSARSALAAGAVSPKELAERLRAIHNAAAAGQAPQAASPNPADLRAPERIVIDYVNASDLADKSAAALEVLATDRPSAWKALRGVYRGSGPAPKIAFLYTGQGSQYLNMLRDLCASEPIVAETFAEADRITLPLLGKPLSAFIFVDPNDPRAVAQAEEDLKQTAITQPAVLTADIALTRLLASHGVRPDMTMGHSLGEYGALVASGAMPFADALEAVSARGREMACVSVADKGRMAAVMAPLEQIERVLKTIDGYVVIANLNSNHQAVIGGGSQAVERAIQAFQAAEYEVIPLPVSHAFHTSIVGPAAEPLRQMLQRLHLEPPRIPIVANVNGEFYPQGPDAVPTMWDILAQQIASPVQFVKGLRTLYTAGARVFIEVGPKKALCSFAEDVLAERGALCLYTNHPKLGDAVAWNQALCALYAAGFGADGPSARAPAAPPSDRDAALGRLFAEVLDRGWEIYHGHTNAPAVESAVITGAALGLPGAPHIFDDGNIGRILRGEQFIDVIPTRLRHAMLDKQINRLVKSETGEATFESISNVSDVIKLAGRGNAFDLEKEFGIPAERLPALDRVTCLAIAAGIDALRDAGIPLVMRYKGTSQGGRLPDRWGLPDALRDDTGVIFASAFPGYDSFAEEMERYYSDHSRREQLALLESLRARAAEQDGASILLQEIDRRIGEVRAVIEKIPYVFDRRFLFRVLSMGHSQFAEYIGARGPNTQINSACASTTQAVVVAEDWIRAGRCRRVVVVSADDITSDHLLEWMGAGFLATGAAATDEVVEEAAVPFDRRRHGMIVGMGAAALVVESAEAARERGLRPICEVLAAVSANSAFHGTRLDVQHIGAVMEQLAAQAETRTGVPRSEMAQHMVFVSHETYTPARGGSASAEIHALRQVFGAAADQIVIANTKGFTGHAMAAGIEDVVAVKALETGCVPPVANFEEVDPELGVLHLSKGGLYPIEYALRLGAGFGSQISMTLLRWAKSQDGVHPGPEALGYAYRIAGQSAWKDWVTRIAGSPDPDLEIVRRTLRVRQLIQTEDRSLTAAARTETLPSRDEGRGALWAPGAVEEDAIQQRVLDIVAEKTGYAKDMLDLDLDLEADLGIDTVKQAEMFASVRAAFGIPRDEHLKLREFPTLAHVIRFAKERQAGQAGYPPGPPVQAPGPSVDAIQEKVLDIVAEKTGYAKDMLDLDLDLEADLGVDTVKQAEMFASVRAAFGIPRDEHLKLRDFPTLAHVIGFARERQTTNTPVAAPVASSERERSALGAGPGAVPATSPLPRRVPVPTLRPPLHLCKPSGVNLGPGCRVLLMSDRGGVGQALAQQLEAQGVEVLRVGGIVDPEALGHLGPLQGIYWLPALDPEGSIADMDLGTWREDLRLRVKSLYTALRALYEQIGPAGTFLMAATRMGGQHGYDKAGSLSPMGGAVAGFVKAYKRERPDALVKVVDLEAERSGPEIAAILLEETLRDPGAVEIGYQDDLRWTIRLEEQSTEDGRPGLALDKSTVFLMTGAAGGIVSAITADLAAASGGTFHLLDLVPEPRTGDPDLARFLSDKEGLKSDLRQRILDRGVRATPVLVEKELAAVERAQAAQSAIDAVRAAGGAAYYYRVDVTDPEAVARVIREVRTRSGRIDVLLHAAGLERSHLLPDKDRAEFDLVFDVKADGWFNLLHAIGDMPLGAAIVFSSVAARFGNAGQTDYAAANDLLCKTVSSMRTTRPATRAIAIDWTAWAGIGMATRGSIPKMMEHAGIEMLPAEAAIPVVRRELSSGGTRGEVLIGQRLGVLEAEWDASGGLDPKRIAGAGPMVGKVIGMEAHQGLTIETTLDPAVQPFLHDHQIEGVPVLPGVMGIEAFAEAASYPLPGWQVHEMRDVNFLAPVKFYRGEPRTLNITAVFRAESEGLFADCRLIGYRSLPNQAEPQMTEHFNARVRLAREAAVPPETNSLEPCPTGAGLAATELYKVYFHGPAYRVLERVWWDGKRLVGQMAHGLPANHLPAQDSLVLAPRLIELSFQTAGLWDIVTLGRIGLPQRIDRLLWWGPADETKPLYAIVHRKETDAFDVDVRDAAGNCILQLGGYHTVAMPGSVDGSPLQALQAVLV